MGSAYQKAIKELDREMYLQVGIIYGCAAIAFKRYWNYGTDHIHKIFQVTEDTWDECSGQYDVSMLQMLEDETEIEMKLAENGKSFHEIEFLNGKSSHKSYKPMQLLYLRQRQKPWVSTMVMAALLLGLHRREHFGTERLARLMGQIVEIREEFGFNQKTIVEEAYNLTGIKIVGLLQKPSKEKECAVELARKKMRRA